MNTIKILFEDNHLLVVVKPANIPVQGDSSKDVDMLTLLKADLAKRHNKTGNVYLGLVHRLDRPVGGVMVFAKTSKCASRLSEQVRARTIQKSYQALVQGHPKKEQDSLSHFLKKNPENNTSSAANIEKDGFKKAELSYHVIQQLPSESLVEVDLKTGRHHQIRCQLSFIGHPIVGDFKYGFNPEKTDLVWNAKKRGIALFATKLCFAHPISKEPLVFEERFPAVS
jgi:23S rRNA pseudouridine1911/1915/1917 synthase